MVRPSRGACLAQVAVPTASRRCGPMGPLQRAPGPPPTAFSQDPPRIHHRERTSLVKNRMRAICTSGSVRGEGGNILTYSAILPLEWSEVRDKGLAAMQAVEVA